MTDERGMGRRHYLGLLSIPTVSGGGFALWRFGPDLRSSASTPDQPALTGLSLQNNGLQEITMDVMVEQSGETVYDKSHTLAGIDVDEGDMDDGAVTTSESGEIVFVDGDWLGEDAEFTVTAEVEGMGTVTHTTEDYLAEQDWSPGDCPGYDLSVVAITMQGTSGNLTAQAVPDPDCQV
jgi:hypothetical protein